MRRRDGGSIWFGLVLVLVGSILFLQQLGGYAFHNWWAFFILIPALSSLWAAVRMYRGAGRLHYGVRSSFLGALIPLAVAILFLFDLSWAVYWPLFVLLPGLILLSNAIPLGEETPHGFQAYRPWLGWMGAGAIYLGIGFLLHNLGFFDPAKIWPTWWGLAILSPAIGGLVVTIHLAAEGGIFSGAALANLIATLVVAMPGVVALLGLSWNLLTPLMLIAVGTVLVLNYFVRR